MPIAKKRRIHAAFFINPEYADTVPTLSVLAALLRRGYRVSYVTTNRFERAVSELGAEFVRCPALSRGPLIESPWQAVTAETLSVVSAFFEANRPDIVIHDTVTLAGHIFANRWKVPAVQVSPDFKMDKRKPSSQAPEFYRDVSDLAAVLDSVLAQYGIRAGTFLFSREELNIYFYSRLFQLDDDNREAGCFYAGRCAPERPYFDKYMPRGDTDNRPVILVSTSTLFGAEPEYFRMCVDALSGTTWNVIFQVNESHDLSHLGKLPENFEVARGRAQTSILPYVDLLICAGGMMTAMEAMYFGVPMLFMTHGHVELEAYAENSVRLGLGVHLRKSETSAPAIRECVHKMSQDDRLLDAVKRMRRVIRAEPGAEEVANRIDEYIESRT